MSEIEAIYRFLRDTAHIGGSIYKDGNSFAVVTYPEKGVGRYCNGETVGDAIRQFYEAQEKEGEKAE